MTNLHNIFTEVSRELSLPQLTLEIQDQPARYGSMPSGSFNYQIGLTEGGKLPLVVKGNGVVLRRTKDKSKNIFVLLHEIGHAKQHLLQGRATSIILTLITIGQVIFTVLALLFLVLFMFTQSEPVKTILIIFMILSSLMSVGHWIREWHADRFAIKYSDQTNSELTKEKAKIIAMNHSVFIFLTHGMYTISFLVFSVLLHLT